MAVCQSSETPIMNCEPQTMKLRTKNWITHLSKQYPSKIVLVSAMADSTKVRTVEEFSHKYNV